MSRFKLATEDHDTHEYAHVHFAGGQVQVKLDDEGVVVDLWDSKGKECYGTLAMTYQDMGLQACESCGKLVPVHDEWDGDPVWCLECYNAALE